MDGRDGVLELLGQRRSLTRNMHVGSSVARAHFSSLHNTNTAGPHSRPCFDQWGWDSREHAARLSLTRSMSSGARACVSILAVSSLLRGGAWAGSARLGDHGRNQQGRKSMRCVMRGDVGRKRSQQKRQTLRVARAGRRGHVTPFMASLPGMESGTGRERGVRHVIRGVCIRAGRVAGRGVCEGVSVQEGVCLCARGEDRTRCEQCSEGTWADWARLDRDVGRKGEGEGGGGTAEECGHVTPSMASLPGVECGAGR